MSDREQFLESIKRNKKTLIAIMMLPVLGMIIAILLILWQSPDSAMITVPIIIVLIVAHGLLIRWILRKMDDILNMQFN